MICPKCDAEMHKPFVALSRDDNRTKVCPDCGTKEAIVLFLEATIWKEQYPV